MSRPLPRIVVHEVAQHGVASYARDVAEAVAATGRPVATVTRDAMDTLPARTPVHLQFTDRLWAASPEQAADVVRRLATQHPFSVTLHDVPQASDGPRNLPRRRACYREVASLAAGVACNSAHEAALLREYAVHPGRTAVIPLPVDVMGALTPDAPLDGAVGVLGFFYPGKGHAEALNAAAEASVSQLTILGRASDGHAADLEAFAREAADRGVAVEVTGYLDDAALQERCRRTAVPVIAHRHVSASGSLGSWIAAGRRPVATSNRYVDEMAVLRPGSMTVVEPDLLGSAVAAAARAPASTWLSRPAVPHGRADVGAAYARWWEGLSW